MNNLVSIIVPFYNVEQYIDRCLKSLICQTYTNIEILLVDDCSPDNTIRIAREYAKKDVRIKLLNYKKNRGLGGARNYGMEKAKGSYLIFVDSDDYIELNSIELLYTKAMQYNLCVLEANYIKERETITEILPRQSITTKEVLTGKEYWSSISIAPVVAWNKLYKLSFLKENGLLFKLRKFEDVAFTAEVFMKANRVMNINFPFYHYIVRENSIMTVSTSIGHLEDSYALIKDMKNLFEKNQQNQQMQKSYLYTYIAFFRLWLLFSGEKKENKNKVMALFSNERKHIFSSKKIGVLQKIVLYISPILTAQLFLLKRG